MSEDLEFVVDNVKETAEEKQARRERHAKEQMRWDRSTSLDQAIKFLEKDRATADIVLGVADLFYNYCRRDQ